MKISRNDPLRRRRSPLSTLLTLAVLILLGLLVAFWVRGGERPVHSIEIPIPADRLGS